MFDPLDLYSADEVDTFQEYALEGQEKPITSFSNELVTKESDLFQSEDSEEESALDVLDLPLVQYAPVEVILCVLLLLKPSNQVNFNGVDDASQDVAQICQIKGINVKLLDSLAHWYREVFPNPNLNTPLKICHRIPLVRATASKPQLLTYYTCALKYYQEKEGPLVPDILRELSMRICENCGRTAQPSMTRDFNMDNLGQVVQLYEPSLTADNLGWKTWGSSLILSQIMVNHLHNSTIYLPNSNKTRVLELGAGTGLVGLSFACKWKELQINTQELEMYSTDLPEITENLKKNVKTNNVESLLQVDVLDWTNPTPFIDRHGPQKFDIILIADPIYSPSHPQWVVDMISKLLHRNGICYLEIPIRPKYSQERANLWTLLNKTGLRTRNNQMQTGKDDWGTVQYCYKEITWVL